MTGRKLPMVCYRLGSKMIARSRTRWPMLISAITLSLLSSGFSAIDVEAAANSYVAANVNTNNNNHHQASVTSSPFVSAAAEAAAAAALGGIDVGRSLVTALLGSPATSTPAPKVHQTVVKMNAATERAVSVQQKQKQAPQQEVTTVTIAAQATTKPTVVAVRTTSTPPPLTLTIAHKHSGKVINVSDTLHKFDLYLDPVCDQINKLTSKQLSKVYVQLKQFSQKNNDALAKCFNGHGFHLGLSAASQQQTRPNRDNLANLCSARSLANEPYKQFSACAARSWSKTMDSEIDHALNDRLWGSKATTSSKSSSQQLTSAEMSLIDDIVAQLQEGHIAEITTELGEQQHGSASGATTTTTSKATGAKEDKSANKEITVQQVAGDSSHQSSGKGETKSSSGASSGKQFHLESTPPSGAVVLSKSSENLSVNEHSAQKAASTRATTTSVTSNLTSFQAPLKGTNLEKDFKANVAGGQFKNNVKLTLITTIAPSFTQHNGPTTGTDNNKAQFSIFSVNNRQQTTGAPSTTSVVLMEDAKKSAQTTQAGSSIKVVEEHKSQSVDLLNVGGNSFKLTAGGTSTQMLTTNQQNSLADARAQALVNNLKSSSPTSLPLQPAVIPAPPTQQTFVVNQKIGSGPPLPQVSVPAQVPLPAAAPIANQLPPPPPTISPFANMMLNSMSLTTIRPLGKGAASASAVSANNQNPPPQPPPPAPAVGASNGFDAGAPAASSASGSQNGPFNAGLPAASAESAASAVGSVGSPLLLAAPMNPPPMAQPPQAPPTAPAAASSAAGAATFQPLPLAGSVPAPPSPLIVPPPPPPPPYPLSPAPMATVKTGAAIVATVPGNKDSPDLLHPDHQLATPTGLAAATPTANAVVAAGTTSASAKNAAGEIAIAQAPTGTVGVKMEHAMLKNVDKALDVLNAAATVTTTTTTTTAKPEKSNKLLEMIGSAVVKETLENAASASSDKVAAIVIPVTTRAPISVIIIEKNDQDNETKQKKSQATSEKSHHDDGELFELTSAHDVIVVGEHVEGDDLVHDHEDHSQHHDEHRSSASIVSSSHHNEHDESDSKTKIEHTNQSSEIKKTTTTTTSTKTKSFVEAYEEGHSDHEYLIEGLKEGDVIHVEAAEFEGHQGGD